VHVLDSVEPRTISSPRCDVRWADSERGLGDLDLTVEDASLRMIASAADGDGPSRAHAVGNRRRLAEDGHIDDTTLEQVLADRTRRFDKSGEQFYDQISALHKSVRSSDPDAAVYWLTRMLDGGCDPLYLARRMTRMAGKMSASPSRGPGVWHSTHGTRTNVSAALRVSLASRSWPIWLAISPKSNAAYMAYNKARATVKQMGTLDVQCICAMRRPKLMKGLGYGSGYQYDHDAEGGVALDQQCLPDELVGMTFYEPVDRGLELKLGEKLAALPRRPHRRPQQK